jgi:hypothetical protein
MARKQSLQDDAPIDVLVTVKDEYRDTLPEVSSRLKSAGLAEEDRFEITGVIAGKAAPEDLAQLREVEGVAAVEQEPTFRAT